MQKSSIKRQQTKPNSTLKGSHTRSREISPCDARQFNVHSEYMWFAALHRMRANIHIIPGDAEQAFAKIKNNKTDGDKFNQESERSKHWKPLRPQWKKLMIQVHGDSSRPCIVRILWKGPYCPKPSTDSAQSLSKFQYIFHRKRTSHPKMFM